nr:MAG TPA: hypothetical protein [Caudoviricetes sp.]DAV85173.1 MAG TPA: hypothetical protein [Caudoviricetes sp.]
MIMHLYIIYSKNEQNKKRIPDDDIRFKYEGIFLYIIHQKTHQ